MPQLSHGTVAKGINIAILAKHQRVTLTGCHGHDEDLPNNIINMTIFTIIILGYYNINMIIFNIIIL
jgi:hypothetical protein